MPSSNEIHYSRFILLSGQITTYQTINHSKNNPILPQQEGQLEALGALAERGQGEDPFISQAMILRKLIHSFKLSEAFSHILRTTTPTYTLLLSLPFLSKGFY